ncbi:MAG: helix-turn-helix transcriptional regulator [Segniliparus sp.]|uniref:helix-turn-helix transcriptional regulator n=1 Tax=Segniliparus sp. TaxID=2804064 RepID=UPI003F386F51
MPPTNLATRLTRMLSIIPYFLAHPGQNVREGAQALGMSVADLHRDLNQLWLCGLPGYSPGDLIDISFAGDGVEVGFSAGVDRPLRLTRTEATLLVVALRALAELPSGVDPTAALSAIAKIEAASQGESSAAPAPPEPESPAIRTARAALASGKALQIRYYSATSDAVTDRIIDPIRVVIQGRSSYIQAWCRASQAVRLFRLDRLDGATELSEPSRPQASPAVPAGFWGESGQPPQALVAVAPESTWAIEHHGMTALEESPASGRHAHTEDGWVVARLGYGSSDWLRRFLLGHGTEIRLLEPAESATDAAESARLALRRYAALANSQPGGLESAGQTS